MIFPNTSPPFAPTMMSEFGEAEVGKDFEKRWAGIRAHNRWLADFCKDAPGRRAGIVQIFLPFVEESVQEIRWAKENGLFGGVLLPGAPPGSGIEPLYSPKYEPIFAVCEELAMPLNHHTGSSTPDFGMYLPQSLAMFMLEVTWWTHRALWHLIFSGVFERHPKLQFTLTESGDRLGARRARRARQLLHAHEVQRPVLRAHLRRSDRREAVSEASRSTSRASVTSAPASSRPRSARDVTRSASTASCGAAIIRTSRAPTPTRASTCASASRVVPEDEIQQMVALNAAKLYGFDLEQLAGIAAKIGPTKAEVAVPLAQSDVPPKALKCPAFAPDTQIAAA